ncbi:LysR family transcriptional regulator [Pararobbsia silviterrae]|uniref:LysR family transcriptional regulator n=1 Tax=Pararobbsia silviterrae TaxID=1792498 RepID=A0A494Y470_9BURK|nr:LysR family transcriptional regulator [Pararobbsia silviterrae]RKP54696.1 LysR family transcriptional regulator [Pararobbsia silviterrae]
MTESTSAGEPSWDLYRSFLGVLDEGSLSGAARALGLTQPTLGRHIDALEATLGLTLFTRSQSGFIPTDAALALGPYARTLASTATALLRAASGHGEGVRGTVRVSASEIVGVEVLPPILAALRARHPELVIELTLSSRIEDLLRREADIAVRMFRPSQDALIARRVGTIGLGLHARRDYLERHGTPENWAALQDHALIGFDTETAYIRQARRAIGGLTREQFALRTDSDIAQLAAIRAGFGIGICQVRLAERDPALVRLLPEAFDLGLDTWIAMHEDLRDSPRCRATLSALVEGLERYIGAPDGAHVDNA